MEWEYSQNNAYLFWVRKFFLDLLNILKNTRLKETKQKIKMDSSKAVTKKLWYNMGRPLFLTVPFLLAYNQASVKTDATSFSEFGRRHRSNSICVTRMWNVASQHSVSINPFHVIGLFLYLLKISENLYFSDDFKGHCKWQLKVISGIKSVNT